MFASSGRNPQILSYRKLKSCSLLFIVCFQCFTVGAWNIWEHWPFKTLLCNCTVRMMHAAACCLLLLSSHRVSIWSEKPIIEETHSESLSISKACNFL